MTIDCEIIRIMLNLDMNQKFSYKGEDYEFITVVNFSDVTAHKTVLTKMMGSSSFVLNDVKFMETLIINKNMILKEYTPKFNKVEKEIINILSDTYKYITVDSHGYCAWITAPLWDKINRLYTGAEHIQIPDCLLPTLAALKKDNYHTLFRIKDIKIKED